MVRGEDGKATIKDPKSKAGIRDIHIGKTTLDTLIAAKQRYDEMKNMPNFKDAGFVVCQKNGEPYKPDSLTQKWNRFMKAKELPHVRLHDLRHSCATAMVGAGVDMETVRQILGHSDVSITMKYYVHATQTMAKNAANTMENVIFKN